MRRVALLLVGVVAVGVGVAAVPAGSGSGRTPVVRYEDKQFGPILATAKKQALYYWSVEKRAGGKIRCTGACAKLWPPLLVKSRAAVRKRVPGISGMFGVVRRPDGRLQVTRNGLAVYTYAHEGPRQVLCNNVDGWFVVRLS
jgi:predicted lipoprotein with Yx(FWY)xxD motif